MPAHPEQVRVAITENRIFFAFEPAAQGKKPVAPRAVLSSTLVEGAFPAGPVRGEPRSAALRA